MTLCLPEGRTHALAHAPGQPDRGIAAASLAGFELLINTCARLWSTWHRRVLTHLPLTRRFCRSGWRAVDLCALGSEFCQDLGQVMVRGIGGRDTAIDSLLKKYFLDVTERHLAYQRAAQVQAQFIPPAECNHGAHDEDSPIPHAQTGPCPYFPPGVANDQILKVAVDVGNACAGPVNMGIAQDAAALSCALFMKRGVRHVVFSVM